MKCAAASSSSTGRWPRRAGWAPGAGSSARWGIGTYRKNDQVDVAWEVDGQPRVAHALDIEKPG